MGNIRIVQKYSVFMTKSSPNIINTIVLGVNNCKRQIKKKNFYRKKNKKKIKKCTVRHSYCLVEFFTDLER